MNRSRWIRAGALVLALLVAGSVVWAVRARPQPAARYYHFTRDAQRVFQRAQEVATRYGHRYIDTAHLLAAFLAEPRGGIGPALRAGGLPPERASAQLQDILATDDRRVDSDAFRARGPASRQPSVSVLRMAGSGCLRRRDGQRRQAGAISVRHTAHLTRVAPMAAPRSKHSPDRDQPVHDLLSHRGPDPGAHRGLRGGGCSAPGATSNPLPATPRVVAGG